MQIFFSHSAADPPKDRYFLGGKQPIWSVCTNKPTRDGVRRSVADDWIVTDAIRLIQSTGPNSRFCLPHEFFFSSPHVIALFLLMQKSNEKEKEKKENADGGRI